jgi:hypothetical protein
VDLRPCFLLLAQSLRVHNDTFDHFVTATDIAKPATFSTTGILVCVFSHPLGRVYSNVSSSLSFGLLRYRGLIGYQALMDTLNMRTDVRREHHSNRPVNLTEIVDRDLKSTNKPLEAQSTASVWTSSSSGLDEHGWFVGNV